MRKRLIWALGLTVVLGAIGAAVALAAANTQTITGKVKPKKLPKTGKAKPVSLFVEVSATNPGNPGGVPNPTKVAKVDFDRDIKIQQKGLATCNSSQFTSATTTQQAKQQCSESKLGGGSATITIPGPIISNVPAVVTAFNGKNKTIVLHTYNVVTAAQTLVGKFGKADPAAGSKYGITLTVPVPDLGGGTGAISQLNVKVKEVYRFRGKQRSFVSSTCKDKKIHYQARFTDNQGQLATGKFTQKCTQTATG